MHYTKVGNGIPNLMKTFDGDWRDHFALLEVGECCGAVWWLGEASGVGLLKTGEKVDLSKGELDSFKLVNVVNGL